MVFWPVFQRSLDSHFRYLFQLFYSCQTAENYNTLSTNSWGVAGTTINYQYYDDGALKQKAVTGNDSHTVDYTYNAQGRLSQIVETRGNTQYFTGYQYNHEGIRTQKTTHSTVSGTGQNDIETISWLIDPANHTGYAQVLEEWHNEETTPAVTYTIGDDIISQADSAGVVKHLLYDGHGSTRQLLEHVLVDNGPGSLRPDIDETFDYDGYGVMLGGNPSRGDSPATSLLYSGESFDSDAQHYYLRARYYNPSNGRFNQTDPYAGNMSDPQSLHKYLYCHANPVNGVDPSGMEFSLTGLMVSVAGARFE